MALFAVVSLRTLNIHLRSGMLSSLFSTAYVDDLFFRSGFQSRSGNHYWDRLRDRRWETSAWTNRPEDLAGSGMQAPETPGKGLGRNGLQHD
jgi:hypothetical protein